MKIMFMFMLIQIYFPTLETVCGAVKLYCIILGGVYNILSTPFI